MAAVKPTDNINLIRQHMSRTLPLVDKELGAWRDRASQIPDANLRAQALQSIDSKAFHCQGGSIFASYPGANRELTIRFIVTYQTISDYLDNLVDNTHVQDEQAFAQLHLAMEEALEPSGAMSDYYAFYPYKDDGGYLAFLVQICRETCTQPSYDGVKQHMLELARLYSALQTYKHLHKHEREEKLFRWACQHLPSHPDLLPWEFAAASGSTIGHFCLYSAAFDPALREADVIQLKSAYFPFVCGLHILLDYLVDQFVDRQTDQLNFVSYYRSPAESLERLSQFVGRAGQATRNLAHSGFHHAVISGLLALYLSDPKASNPEVQSVAQGLLQQGGTSARMLYWLCRLLRRARVIG